jgi:cytochrome c553
MKYILCVSLMILLTSGVQAELKGDSADGKRLHEARCKGCHDTSVYAGKARTVRNLDELKQQIEST